MSVKEIVQKTFETLPDDITWDEIQYRLYVCEAIEKGLLEMENDPGIPHDEAEEIMKSWND